MFGLPWIWGYCSVDSNNYLNHSMVVCWLISSFPSIDSFPSIASYLYRAIEAFEAIEVFEDTFRQPWGVLMVVNDLFMGITQICIVTIFVSLVGTIIYAILNNDLEILGISVLLLIMFAATVFMICCY